MKEYIDLNIELLLSRYPELSTCREDIIKAYYLISDCYSAGGKLLVVGNGGSAADAEHIVGELMKGFKLPRKLDDEYRKALMKVDCELGSVLAENLQEALPAIALDGQIALTTAYMNDCEPLLCFAQQVNGYGKAGDVLFALSTSGNSENVLFAAIVAKAKGMRIVGLTGAKASKLSSLSLIHISPIFHSRLHGQGCQRACLHQDKYYPGVR